LHKFSQFGLFFFDEEVRLWEAVSFEIHFIFIREEFREDREELPTLNSNKKGKL
jgi:hypothetical protein